MPTKDNRGFQTFADFKCSYGTEIIVKESSAATNGPHIWLFMEEDRNVLNDTPPGQAAAHMTFAQAKKLMKALEKAMAEHYQVKA